MHIYEGGASAVDFSRSIVVAFSVEAHGSGKAQVTLGQNVGEISVPRFGTFIRAGAATSPGD